jgi:hypothetical protein
MGLAAITRRDLAPSRWLLRLTAQVDKQAVLDEYKTTDERPARRRGDTRPTARHPMIASADGRAALHEAALLNHGLTSISL